jgi:hypothetical protein
LLNIIIKILLILIFYFRVLGKKQNKGEHIKMTSNATDNETVYDEEECPGGEFGTPTERWIKTFACVLVLLMSVIVNSFVIFIVCKKQRVRSVTNCLVANMACSDLLIGSVNMPNMIAEEVNASDAISFGGILGSLVCKLLVFSQDISAFCSILCLIAIAIERYFAIFFPFKKYFTLKNVRYVIITCWFVSAIVASPLLYANKISELESGTYACEEAWSPAFGADEFTAARAYTTITFVLLYALPLVSICSLYIAVVYRLWNQKIPGDQRTPQRRQHRSKAKKRVLKMLIAIVLAFALCWLPYHLYFILDGFHPPFKACSPPYELFFAAKFLAYSNSAISPCIFISFDINVRKYLYKRINPCCETLSNQANERLRHKNSAIYSSQTEPPNSRTDGVKLKVFKTYDIDHHQSDNCENGITGVTQTGTPDLIAGHRNVGFMNENFTNKDIKRRTVSFAQ